MPYTLEVEHKGLGRRRVVRAADRRTCERLAEAQVAQWEELWQRKQSQQAARESREAQARERDRRKANAAARTTEARAAIDRLRSLLADSLTSAGPLQWDDLFASVRPPARPATGPEPHRSDIAYNTPLSFTDRVFRARSEAKASADRSKYLGDRKVWEQAKVQADNEHKRLLAAHAESERRRQAGAMRLKDAYLSGDARSIEWYCRSVLERTVYPVYFPRELETHYGSETRVLLVNYRLPAPGDLPTLTEVNYVVSADRFDEKQLPQAAQRDLYDAVVYQVAIRVLHDLWSADQASAVDSIVLNGWVRSLDPRTGIEITTCILSVCATRDDLLSRDLAHLDAKECFRDLRGIGSSSLHSLCAVAPIMSVPRDDPRFVNSREVAAGLSDATNIAAMPWEDFEHLVRELFEAEFSQSGGEVRVTQASRDGGVDAVAFDPDPVRGGKMVIQAKRYTITVGVAAVRDLYGTVVSEGAMKGILITTSDYGPDAHEFAKGKPLTLLNGSHLLHMLQKHGHKAMIDLEAARAASRDVL